MVDHAGLDALNRLPRDAADAALRRCCGSRAWVRAMLEARPFSGRATLLAHADVVWWSLGAGDWLEAFTHHPRIGERPQPAADTSDWAAGEQAGTAAADAAVLAELESLNHEYEARFDHVFLICATGRSADEMLAALRERLGNDPGAELRIAAEEQRKITRLRLEKLLEELAPAPPPTAEVRNV
jgi:OHCU decarboxylase